MKYVKRQWHHLGLCAGVTLTLMGCGDLDLQHPLQNDTVIFFIGQESETLDEFKREVLDVDPQMPPPFGVTSYVSMVLAPDGSIIPGGEALAELYGPHTDFFGDVENFPSTLEAYPDQAISLGVYVSDAGLGCTSAPLRAIAGYDDADVQHLIPLYRGLVDELILFFKKTDRHVFLRIGNEVDIPGQCHDPQALRGTFKYFKERIEALEAEKLYTVWQLTGFTYDIDVEGSEQYDGGRDDYYDLWYPGDAYVDWVAMSMFVSPQAIDYQWANYPEEFLPFIHLTPREEQQRILAFAREHQKPVFITEGAPQGFQVDKLTVSSIYLRDEIEMSAQQMWDLWYADWFDFIEQNKDIIKAAAYINTDWNERNLFGCADDVQNCPFGYWGDSRIHKNDLIYHKFKTKLRSPLFYQMGYHIEDHQ